ncbi:MAG: DEAD/DEAH box helicase [Pseudomonadota bacterium]|nr:DEAD/DEAH box helicase [Pseudomonadota bacterium]
MTNVGNILDAAHIDALASALDDAAFQAVLDNTRGPPDADLVELKIGALFGYEELIATIELQANLYGPEPRLAREALEGSERVFEQWQAYISAAIEHRRVEMRDLLLLTATGLAARRPTELRQLLGLNPIGILLQTADDDATWPLRVQTAVMRTLILTARQRDRDDILSAQTVVEQLSALQAETDREWLVRAPREDQAALTLLSLYHAAQATIVIISYLLDGEVRGRRGQILNPATELEVLLNKAHEYAELSSDPELMTWTRSVALIVAKLRSDSIWSNGLNITDKIDSLIRNMSAREGAIYSMLPSQQEALGSNLLDPRQEAVVLQMPTSSGKTLMAELAAVQTVSSYADAKIVYLTPTRALATQVKRTLSADLSDLDIPVTTAGSAFEEDPFELALLEQVKGVVVSTPEKLDLLLRAHADWFSTVRLVIVDEAHLLKDGERGARLELLLANLRREHIHIRLLLLTPFVENAKDVAEWLSAGRSHEVGIQWRPSRLIVGLTKFSGRGDTRAIEIEWKEPHRPNNVISPTRLPLTAEEREELKPPSVRSNAVVLCKRLRAFGPSLAMFPGSRINAEKAALAIAGTKPVIDPEDAPAEFRVALALATADYGANSDLAKCLARGVAFHHSALSGELRYLVERLAALGVLDFIAATTTLAQGMNFPVSSVVIHSVAKPHSGPLSPGEFWNIAGRAGRVGLSEKGVVVFANPKHRGEWERYTTYLNERVDSALTSAIEKINETDTIKWTYKINEGIRPFIQYLGHAVATLGARETQSELERLVAASFAGKSAGTRASLMRLARRYVAEVSGKQSGYMKTADQTGLASFSFDELYASIGSDPILARGNATEMQERDGLKHLIDALVKLPELSLALEKGQGTINTRVVAEIVHQWMNGATIYEIAPSFSGDDEAERIRQAGKYVFGKVSQTVSWGAHAYVRGRDMLAPDTSSLDDVRRMLPAYIQYGVNDPGAVLASLFGVPRQAAPGIAAQYAAQNGDLRPGDNARFRLFLENSPVEVWRDAMVGSRVENLVSPDDLRHVWRDAQGLRTVRGTETA